jgi:transcription antitermination factor NusG
MTDEAKWYIIYIGDAKKITAVSTALYSCNIQHVLWTPMQNVYQQFRGKSIIKPKTLLPGYTLAKFIFQEGSGIEDKLTALGCFLLKGPGARIPEAATQEFIEGLKTIEVLKGTEDVVENTYNLAIGDTVEVINGPFLSGMGPIVAIKKGKVRVELEIMNRSVEVELHPSQCTKVLSEKETSF